MTTWSQQLDDWTAALAAETGLSCTRDPDLIHPPCVYVTVPESVTAPISSAVLELPVHVIGGMAGKQELDAMLDTLPIVLDATAQQNAQLTTITVGDIPYNAYQVTVPVRFDPPPVPAPI